MTKDDFRDREATIAGLERRISSGAGMEIDYPTLLPCELRLLLKFWIRVAIEIGYYQFLAGNIDGCDTTCRELARERVQAIQNVFGTEDTQDAISEVRSELGQHEDPRYWSIFWNGTPAEKTVAQAELRRLVYQLSDTEVA